MTNQLHQEITAKMCFMNCLQGFSGALRKTFFKVTSERLATSIGSVSGGATSGVSLTRKTPIYTLVVLLIMRNQLPLEGDTPHSLLSIFQLHFGRGNKMRQI